MTHAERLLWLAELETERAGYAFHPEGARVPRFPTLRQVCPVCKGDKFCNPKWGCQGRGFVPVDSLEATMEAIGAPVAFDYTKQGEWACCLPPRGEWGWTPWCPTPNEAAVLVLVLRETHLGGCYV